MIVYVVHHETICGHFTHELSLAQAAWWLKVLTENEIKHRVEYRFVDEPKQLEFFF